jgi:hypothetical protein
LPVRASRRSCPDTPVAIQPEDANELPLSADAVAVTLANPWRQLQQRPNASATSNGVSGCPHRYPAAVRSPRHPHRIAPSDAIEMVSPILLRRAPQHCCGGESGGSLLQRKHACRDRRTLHSVIKTFS